MSVDTQQVPSSSPSQKAITVTTEAMPMASRAPHPQSIFRQPSAGSTVYSLAPQGNADGNGVDSSLPSSSISATSNNLSVPAHWPIARSPLTTHHLSPRFEDDPISSIRFRPRTPPEDIPTLFYSALDVKRFKGEYHQLLRNKGYRRQITARRSSAPVTTQMGQHQRTTYTKSSRQAHPHAHRQNDNSHDCSRDDIGARSCRKRSPYYDPLNDGTVVSDDEYDGEGGSLDQHNTPIDDSSPLTIVGLQGHISSAFDMVRDTVSAWNVGHISGSTGQQRRRRPSITTVQLVDTLYLF